MRKESAFGSSESLLSTVSFRNFASMGLNDSSVPYLLAFGRFQSFASSSSSFLDRVINSSLCFFSFRSSTIFFASNPLTCSTLAALCSLLATSRGPCTTPAKVENIE